MANQTRREDSQATRREELQETRREDLPATRHEQESSLPAATRHDAGPAETRREGSVTGSLLRLPAALSDRYRIIQSISTRGGEADLLRVESAADGQPAVIKLYRPGIEPKTAVLEKIQRCAQEHVIGLLEHGQSEGIWYEVLEYAQYGSLRDRLQPGQPLSELEARTILQEIHAALRDLHRNGIIHRDLKPENILIRTLEPLNVVLTDFGIASAVEATMHFTSANRTVRYAAPEAMTGIIGTASDYWSLGMILVEALSGRHPFDGLSEQVINSHLITKPVPLGNIQEPWLTLCRGLLLRDPKNRWQSLLIEQWLSGDRTLKVANDSAPTTSDYRANRPYRFHGQECWTAQELAIQLAKYWDDAVKDLSRGLIAPWLRDELRDQDATRVLMDLMENEKLTPDERVLRLIMHLAPDLPIVYKGFSLSSTTDLEAIAQQGLQGNEECQNFIFNLHKQRILESFSGPQYSYLQKIQRNWVAAEKDYNQSWKLVLDQKGPTKFKPNFIKVALPSLLLMSISTKIQEEMRQEIKSKTTDYAMGCEWFTVLGSPEKASCSLIFIMQLLVSEADRVVRDSHNHLVREISTLKKEFSNLIESCDSQTASDILDLEQSSSQISYRAILEKTDKIPYIKTKGRKELEFNDMIKNLKRDVDSLKRDYFDVLANNSEISREINLIDQYINYRDQKAFDMVGKIPNIRDILLREKTNINEQERQRREAERRQQELANQRKIEERRMLLSDMLFIINNRRFIVLSLCFMVICGCIGLILAVSSESRGWPWFSLATLVVFLCIVGCFAGAIDEDARLLPFLSFGMLVSCGLAYNLVQIFIGIFFGLLINLLFVYLRASLER